MKDSVIIDKIYGALVGTVSGADYDFHSLGRSWGYRSGEIYQRNMVVMNKNVRKLGKECPVLFNEGDYWLFDGRIYVPIREELIVAAFYLLVEHLEILPAINNKMFAKTFTDAIRYYNPMVQSRNLVAFENGVLDIAPILKGKKPIFHDHFDPRFHVTYYHPYAYDEKARCTRWLNFLHEVLPDKNSRVILQMFLGLGLIDSSEVYLPYEGRDAARVELCLLLIGSGGNGKSVIYRTARGVYGSDRISEVPYVELTMTGDEGMRSRLPLRHKIFNWSTEEDGKNFCRKHTSTFKKIVSGEPVMDRKLGGNVTKNDNLPYLVFHLNELPYPDDQSFGFIRRLQFISFDITVPKERRNPRLAQELITNYPGIFNWIVRGAREVVRRKFVFPTSEGHRRQMLLAQLRSNPVIAWINAYQMRPDMRAQNEMSEFIDTKTLLDSLAQFCEDNNVECPSKQAFGAAMSRYGVGFFKRRYSEGVRYQVFGCTSDRLLRPYVIRNEDFSVPFDDENGTYIDEND
jgi:putative DNA primase/helicase